MRAGSILTYTQPGATAALAPLPTLKRKATAAADDEHRPRRHKRRKPVDPQVARRAALARLCTELGLPEAPSNEADAKRRKRYGLLPRTGPPLVAVFSRSRNKYVPCCRVGNCKNPSANRVTTAEVERVCVCCAKARKARERKKRSKKKAHKRRKPSKPHRR